jgi:uncharacterized protein YecE (DUF72 family)
MGLRVAAPIPDDRAPESAPMPRPPAPQLPLFGAAAPEAPAGPAPAPCPPELWALAEAMPARLTMGTSSWGFAGWQGLVYAEAHPEAALSAAGLPAYAAHPLLRAVGLDRTHYSLASTEALRALGDGLPPGFRFLVKAHEDLTLARFPAHARYGARRGLPNPRFLDAAWAIDQVVGPAVEGLGPRLGCLLFQLAPQEPSAFGPALEQRLLRFFRALPAGPPYALEVRNRGLLGPALRAALDEGGVTPCLSIHSALPSIGAQLQAIGRRDQPLFVRWMLQPGLDYALAKGRYHPFDRLVEPRPDLRAELARLAVERLRADQDVLVIVNNKAEGSAPLSVLGLAERIAERLRATDPRG